jgi:protein arginine kinase activator
MQCDVCQDKAATVFLSQILKGEVHKVNLCQACAKAQNVTDPTGFALAEMLWGMGSHESLAQPKEKSCPACGLPHHVFRKSGRLGCSHCYQIFADNVGNLLKTMHKGTQHTGKKPFGWQPTVPPPLVPETPPAPVQTDFAVNISQLLEALHLAVAKEQYEEAARLRDEISRMETAATKLTA